MKLEPIIQLDEEFQKNWKPSLPVDSRLEEAPSRRQSGPCVATLCRWVRWLMNGLLGIFGFRRQRKDLQDYISQLKELPDGRRLAGIYRILKKRNLVSRLQDVPNDIRWALQASQRVVYRAREWINRPPFQASLHTIAQPAQFARSERVLPVTIVAAELLDAVVHGHSRDDVAQRAAFWMAGPEPPALAALRDQIVRCTDMREYRILLAQQRETAVALLRQILDARPKFVSIEPERMGDAHCLGPGDQASG